MKLLRDKVWITRSVLFDNLHDSVMNLWVKIGYPIVRSVEATIVDQFKMGMLEKFHKNP